eukprot:TRINITY_DN37298_c0_g2_i1.p1 TRINITY_DN37298_c0_g2~~TRINITY_DN37298_c0_g2_i1.p1  ORF type:complete len:198 (-),score=42.27 TRINITY_DN37298_c0_g2_i1:32-625(-)
MGQNATMLSADEVWKLADRDKSGYLDDTEVREVIDTLWQRYGMDRQLSPAFINGIMKELDRNGDNQISLEEFNELYQDLWNDREKFFANYLKPAKAKPGAGVATAPAGTNADWLRCPHCAMEIDPRGLEKLRVPPEAVSMAPSSWSAAQGGGAAAGSPAGAGYLQGASLPPGTVVRGNVPTSFLQGPHNWYLSRPRQ